MGPYAVSVDPEETIVVADASSHGEAAVLALHESYARGWSAHPARVVVYVTDGTTDERVEVDIVWTPSFAPTITTALVPERRAAAIRGVLQVIIGAPR